MAHVTANLSTARGLFDGTAQTGRAPSIETDETARHGQLECNDGGQQFLTNQLVKRVTRRQIGDFGQF